MSNVIIPDISHHETVKDWGEVATNAPFLVMKATQRTNWIDPTLKSVVAGCRRHNIPYWLFSYVEKGNIQYHIEQVRYLIQVTKDLGILGDADTASDKYFVGWVLDIENGNSLDGALAATKYLYSHCGTFKMMVYTGHKDYKRYKKLIDYILTVNPEKVGWWESRYGKNKPKYNPFYPPHKGCDLHQYTEYGKYPGIEGDVDLNRLTGTQTISWFTSAKAVPIPDNVVIAALYSGEKVKVFPDRGFYRKGDGYLVLTGSSWKKEIKKIQKMVSWVSEINLTIDGDYGAKTVEAVKRAQIACGIRADGLFGPKTAKACMKYERRG